MEPVLLGHLLPEVLLGCGDVAAGTNRGVDGIKIAHIHHECIGQVAVASGGRSLRLGVAGSGWLTVRLLVLGVLNGVREGREARVLVVFAPVEVFLAIFGGECLVHGVRPHVLVAEIDGTDCDHCAHQSVADTAELSAVEGDSASHIRERNVLEGDFVARVDPTAFRGLNGLRIVHTVEANAAGGPAQAGVPQHEDVNDKEDGQKNVSIVGLEVDVAERALKALLCRSLVVVGHGSEVGHDSGVQGALVTREGDLLLLGYNAGRLGGKVDCRVQLKLRVHAEHDDGNHGQDRTADTAAAVVAETPAAALDAAFALRQLLKVLI